jgi:hypothetical protein
MRAERNRPLDIVETEDPPRCAQQGYDLHHDANAAANVSNVAFAVGGAALIAGAIVYLTAPRGEARDGSELQVKIGPRA